MNDFLKTHKETLKTLSLLLMLVIPYFMYQGAVQESLFQVKLFSGLMMANMLFVMTKG